MFGKNTRFGATPFGGSTPTSSAPRRRHSAGARYIDPVTRDYVRGEDGRLLKVPPNRQRVMLALATSPGSSAVLPDLGLSLPGVIDDRFVQKVNARVRAALSSLVEEGAIAIRQITVLADGGHADIGIEYTDLSTGHPEEVSLPR